MKKEIIISAIITSVFLALSGCNNVGGISSVDDKASSETVTISSKNTLTKEAVETQMSDTTEYTYDDVERSSEEENTMQEESTRDPALNYITLRTSSTTNNPDSKYKTIEYTYSSDGKLNSAKFDDLKHKYSYNEDGYIIMDKASDGTADEYVIDSIGARHKITDNDMVFEFDEEGRVSDKNVSWGNTHWEYDISDRPIKKETFRDGVLDSCSEYVYTENGILTKEKIYQDGALFSYLEEETITTDTAEINIKRYYGLQYDIPVIEKTETQTYDLKGNIISLKVEDYNGREYEVITGSYSNDGSVYKCVYTYTTVPSSADRDYHYSGVSYEYVYNSDGQLIEKYLLDGDGNRDLSREISTAEYDDNGNLMKTSFRNGDMYVEVTYDQFPDTYYVKNSDILSRLSPTPYNMWDLK